MWVFDCGWGVRWLGVVGGLEHLIVISGSDD